MADVIMPFTKEAEEKKKLLAQEAQAASSRLKLPNLVTKKEYEEIEKARLEAKPAQVEEGPSRAVRELPSILDIGVSNLLGSKVDNLDAIKASAAILSTPDQEGQINILRNYSKEPVSVAYDPQGNAIVNVGGRLAMLNKPGADLFDVTQVASQIALMTPAGRAGAGAATLGSAALRAGLGSAATQAVVSAGTQLAGREATLSQLGAEIGLAGAGGALGEAGGRLISAAIAKRSGAAVNPADEELLREAAQRLGLNVDDMSDELIKQAQRQASTAVAPETRLALQGEQEFGIPLTAGQRMGPQAGAAQLSLEERLRTGLAGEKAQQTMLEFAGPEGAQTEAINRAREELVSRLTFGREVPTGRQAVGETVSEAVRQAEETASRTVSEAYNAVGKAELSGKGFTDLLNATKNAIKGIEFPKNKELVPAANALNNEITNSLKFFSGKQIKEIKPADIKRIESVRKAIRAYYNAAANPTDRRNLQAMSQAFDDYLDSAVAKSLFTGDQGSIEALKQARGTFADYASKFRAKAVKTPSGTIQDPIGKFVERMIAENPNGTEVVNAVFGADGLSARAGQKMAQRIKSIVGSDSDAWISIKREAFERLIKTDKSNGRDYISGSKTLSAIDKAMEKNSELVKEIFTPEELGTIKRFALQVKRTQPDFIKSRENPSGTTQVAGKALADTFNKLRAALNLTGDMGIAATNAGIEMVGGLGNRAKARAAIKPFGEAMGPSAISSVTAPAGAAAAIPAVQPGNTGMSGQQDAATRRALIEADMMREALMRYRPTMVGQ
jgi:hypothetical protein